MFRKVSWAVLFLLACCVGRSLGHDGIATLDLIRDGKRRVMDLTSRRRNTLTKKERSRLDQEIRKRIPQEDVQILVVDNVESGYSPDEMVSHLYHEWKIGEDYSERGILMLVVMEQNRIEIEFGDGLAHLMDAEWCQELLISKVVPMFRQQKYAMGLQEAIVAIEELLSAQDKSVAPRRRKGKWAGVAAMIGLGHYVGVRQNDPPPPPPPHDQNGYDDDKKHERGFRAQRDDYPKTKRDWFGWNQESNNTEQGFTTRNSRRRGNSRRRSSHNQASFFQFDDLARIFSTTTPHNSVGGRKQGDATTFNIYNAPPSRGSDQIVQPRETTTYHNPLQSSTPTPESSFTSTTKSESYTNKPLHSTTPRTITSTNDYTSKNHNSGKVKIQPRSSGGGAVWSSLAGSSLDSMSGRKGAGATWSSPSSAVKNRSSSHTNKKQEGSQNGAGASW